MSTVGSISYQNSSSGTAAGVSLSSCDKQWQIEIDVPRIYYLLAFTILLSWAENIPLFILNMNWVLAV